MSPTVHPLTVEVLSLNVCGLKTKFISRDFVNFIKYYDVLCFCETKTDDVDMLSVKDVLERNGFDSVFKNRSRISRYKSGGLLIAVKKNVSFKWKQIRNDYGCLLSIKIDKEAVNLDKELVLSCVYIPPSHSRYGSAEHFEELDDFLLTHTNDDYVHVLCGDFNAHTLTIPEIDSVNVDDLMSVEMPYLCSQDYDIPTQRYNQDITPDRNSYGRKLVEFCKNNQLFIFNGRLGEDCGVGKPTTTYHTTIDYFIGSLEVMQSVEAFKVLDFDPMISDVHCGLCTRLKLKVSNAIPLLNTNIQEFTESIRPGKWNVEKKSEYMNYIDEDKVNEMMANIHDTPIDDINHELKQILIEPALKTFPQTKGKSYIKKSNNANLVGYDRQCWRSRQEYHKARHRYHMHKTSSNFNTMTEKSKTYKRNLKRVKSKEQTILINKLRSCKGNNSREYWKVLNGQKKDCHIPVKLNDFYEHFRHLADDHFDELDVGTLNNTDNTNIDPSQILNDPITKEEVLRNIKKLKNGKSPGIDMVLNEYIKSTQNLLCPLYIGLFNKILDTGVLPADWLVGVVVPLYKNKGDMQDVNNYRGITLLSCMGKLFTSILNERLNNFSNAMNIINETQAGFRQGYCTLDHIFLLKCVIDLFNWKRKRLFCLFVDYKKAFDMIWREGLWYKLVKENVQGKILNVIKNMYSNIRSCVMLNQQVSDTFVCNVGVRQGESLSPMLFAFYINDMENKLLEHGCNYINFSDDFINTYLKLLVLMYADDTIILCDTEEGMRQALLALYDYCNEWKLKLNCNKSKIVVFSRGKVHQDNYDFVFGSENIEVVEDYKYLGLLFNYNGRFRKGELELKEQATRAMYSVIGKGRKFDLPVDIQIDLFNTMVLPILTYACEVWGHYVVREIELLHLSFLKHILFVHKRTINDMVYGELGVYPLNIFIKCKMIAYWARMISGRETKLCFVMYKCLLHLDRSGIYTSPWIACIKNICNECGMSWLWLTQTVPNVIWVKKAVELRLKDQWITTWRSNIETKSLCSNYRIIKLNYGMEDYILKMQKSNRILLTKLRTLNNGFPVNVGRYTGVPREDRICSKCDANAIGDEYHVLFICNNTDIVMLRARYIPEYFVCRPSYFKYTSLMQSTNVNILKNLSLFVKAVLSMFR